MAPYTTKLDELPGLLTSSCKKCEHEAEVLLLTCIDFRFFEEVTDCIKKEGLVGKFDHVIIAGAELGPVVDFPPAPKMHWQQFFLEHLQLSLELHCIRKVLVLGHRDCGAYIKFEQLEKGADPKLEVAVHEKHACRLQALIKHHHPELEFEARLLDETTKSRNEKKQEQS